MTTEREMLDRLNRRYGPIGVGNGGIRYARAEHVKDGVGFDHRRVCDYMALDLWNGGYGRNAPGPMLHGFEVKCSRADWLTELRDPDKAEAFRPYCDFWWLVVSDAAIVKPGELPEGWGLLVATAGIEEKREERESPYTGRVFVKITPAKPPGLRVKVPAPRNDAVLPMDRRLQATFSRAVTKTAVRLEHGGDGVMRAALQGMHLYPEARA